MSSPQKSVEIFHLLFLRHLSEKLDKRLYAVKGGCNLRFFFKSIRYSEDLDIDVRTVAQETLRNKINRVLESPAFQQALSSSGMEIKQSSEPKQTETTQRWKLGLKHVDSMVVLPTKIECSRRSMTEAFVFEPIDPELISRYQLYPILANHYTQEAAFCQKIDALIHRTEVQARDLFDIHLLLNRGVQSQCLPISLKKELDVAVNNALSIDFSEFKSKVVVYLMNEYQSYYDSKKVWDEIQAQVISKLEEMR